MKHLAAILLGLAAAGSLARVQAASESDNVFRLPPFEVAGERPWLYAALPGYEVLSIEEAGDTQRIVESLQQAGRVMPLLFPVGHVTAFTSPVALFLDRYSRSGVIGAAQIRLGMPRKIGFYTEVAQGRAIQFASPDVIASWLAGRTSPAGLVFSATAALVQPGFASWYIDGLASQLQLATLRDDAIVFDARRWRTAELIPVQELLGLTTQAHAIRWADGSAADRTRYLDTAALFFRWGFFSENGKHRAALMALALERSPASDPVFAGLFGLTVEQQERSMLQFAETADGASATLRLPRAAAAAQLPPVTVRPATQAEVLRLVGGSYAAMAENSPEAGIRGKYRGLARGVLKEAGAEGERDPGLRLALAHLEYLEGNFAGARTLLEGTSALQPFPLLLQARLRLAEAGAELGDGRPLAAAVEDRVREPLLAALKLRPRVYEVYQLLADLRSRTGDRAPPQELTLLERGTHEFAEPEETGLLLEVARILQRQLQSSRAREMVERRLATSGVAGTPSADALHALRLELLPFPYVDAGK